MKLNIKETVNNKGVVMEITYTPSFQNVYTT